MDYSVVIPVFNGADTIAAAIASVLEQVPPPKAVIVVNDGSSDETAAIVAAIPGPITLISQPNAGPGAATTRGFDQVETEYLATLDADDLWLPGKMALQLARLAENPGLAAVFAPLISFRGDPAHADPKMARGGWSRSTMVIRCAEARRIGPVIDPPGGLGEMVDWFARGLEQGMQFELLAEPLALRRIRAGSLTWNRENGAQGYLQVARAALLRRRARDAAKDPNP